MLKKLMITSMVAAKAVLLAMFSGHALMNQDLSLNAPADSDVQWSPFPEDWGDS